MRQEPTAVQTRLPNDTLPVLGCWFWHDDEFAPEGYRPFLDQVGRHAAYNLLTTSIRAPEQEVTDPRVHDQIGRAAAYARRFGIGLVMDLDVRLARAAYRQAYPDEMQEMLRLREVALPEVGQAELRITSVMRGDHYTFRATPYIPLTGRVVRVYTYERGPGGIVPGSLRLLPPSAYRVKEASAYTVRVTIPDGAVPRGRWACLLAAFAHFTPDVFAPHLLSFQRAILRQYADLPLAGACKDEWGFPPCFDGCPEKNDFWFSEPMAAEYARRTGGRDLVADCLLMYLGEPGREAERQAAINHFMAMCWQRNAAVEEDFYRATKETFGRKAIVGTHATWWPNPDPREFWKNGLDWWVARRDLAQTDEVTPYPVRTALAKKWGSAVWYNMFYASSVEEYHRELWCHALGGGRINYHPAYPSEEPVDRTMAALLRGGLMRGDCRVRLLNYVSRSPIDCPVAVIFGHAGAMNWAGPTYDDVGLALTDALWRAGYPADLIPADEIAAGALKIGRDGPVRYGAQRYAAVVLYHPEFEPAATAAFFRRAARGKTALYRLGEWTRDFEARPFDGAAALPASMEAFRDVKACAAAVISRLRDAGIAPQTPATKTIGWDRASAGPPPAGQLRLVDGTHILLAGAKEVSGDPIQATLTLNGQRVRVAAIGVAAVRLDAEGRLEALAAGGLRRFEGGGLQLSLAEPVDLALWRDRHGRWRGVLQGWEGPVPAALAALTQQWQRLALPEPLDDHADTPS